jgi:hypothetical protein
MGSILASVGGSPCRADGRRAFSGSTWRRARSRAAAATGRALVPAPSMRGHPRTAWRRTPGFGSISACWIMSGVGLPIVPRAQSDWARAGGRGPSSGTFRFLTPAATKSCWR